jgi:hypothetical protein
MWIKTQAGDLVDTLGSNKISKGKALGAVVSVRLVGFNGGLDEIIWAGPADQADAIIQAIEDAIIDDYGVFDVNLVKFEQKLRPV